MQSARLAALVPGTDLHLVFAFPFRDGEPSHLRAFTTRLERWYREHRVAGTLTPIYGSEESLLVQTICAAYRARPTTAHWGTDNRGVAGFAVSFLGGVPAIRTYPRGYRAVYFCSKARKSPCLHFDLGKRLREEVIGRYLLLVSTFRPIKVSYRLLLTLLYFPVFLALKTGGLRKRYDILGSPALFSMVA